MSIATKNEARVCTAADLFEADAPPPPEFMEAVNAYLAQFAAPVRRDGKVYCLSCDQPVNGLMEALGFGVAFRWGLAHGEAACSGCGWPARGVHYIKDSEGRALATLSNVFLSYMPRKGSIE